MNALDVFYEELVKRAGAATLLARAGRSVGNFAKRQAHGLTGAYAGDAARIGLNPKNVEAGITSLPGIARGLARHPGSTVRSMSREAMSGGKAGLALGVGLPTALSAPDLVKGDETEHGGRSMRQKVVGLGSGIVGGALTAGVPILPQLAGGVAIDAAANKALGGRKRRQQEGG